MSNLDEKKKHADKEIGTTVDAIITSKAVKGFPKWEDMPKTDNILVLSWEDIFGHAKGLGTTLSRAQVIKAFDIACKNSDNEYMMGAFWANVEYAIDEVKD